jgi:hypothetical protein
MGCWPKDKVPRRSSSGDRWREHQLVSFSLFFSLPFFLYKHHNFIVVLVDDNKAEGL